MQNLTPQQLQHITAGADGGYSWMPFTLLYEVGTDLGHWLGHYIYDNSECHHDCGGG